MNTHSRRPGIILVTGAAGLLAVTACGGVESDGHYESADELRSAMESEGYRCAESRTDPVLEGHGEEMQCEEGHSVVVWEADLPEYVDDPTALFAVGLTERHYLTNETWAVVSGNGEMLDDMQETFGGNRVEPNEDLLELLNG